MKNSIDKGKLPKHIAIIMDGNGRWAKKRGNQRIFGHKNAVKAVREVTEAAAELGIGYLTLFAFSTENWNRPRTEVNALMNLLVSTINSEVKTLNDNNIRLQAIGNLDALPANARKELKEAIGNTGKNTGLTLILALSYGSRWEIIEAVNGILRDEREGKLPAKNIDENTFRKYLATAEYPDPELMIRTSGEIRISNFLLFQLAYAELYYTDVLWPDFRKEELYMAILEYQKRERRFGKTSEQLMEN